MKEINSNEMTEYDSTDSTFFLTPEAKDGKKCHWDYSE